MRHLDIKQRCLTAVLAFNETLHAALRQSGSAEQIKAFLHRPDPKLTFLPAAGCRFLPEGLRRQVHDRFIP